MPLAQGVGGHGGRVEGDDAPPPLGAQVAQGVNEAGVVEAVDGGLNEDNVAYADLSFKGEGILEGVRVGTVHGGGGEGVVFDIEDVHVRVPCAGGDALGKGAWGRRRHGGGGGSSRMAKDEALDAVRDGVVGV